jgi:hypothetical protein
MNSRDAIRAFVADLRKHIEQLRTGNRRMGSRKLADFRSFAYGEDDALSCRFGRLDEITAHLGSDNDRSCNHERTTLHPRDEAHRAPGH